MNLLDRSCWRRCAPTAISLADHHVVPARTFPSSPPSRQRRAMQCCCPLGSPWHCSGVGSHRPAGRAGGPLACRSEPGRPSPPRRMTTSGRHRSRNRCCRATIGWSFRCQRSSERRRPDRDRCAGKVPTRRSFPGRPQRMGRCIGRPRGADEGAPEARPSVPGAASVRRAQFGADFAPSHLTHIDRRGRAARSRPGGRTLDGRRATGRTPRPVGPWRSTSPGRYGTRRRAAAAACPRPRHLRR